MIYAKNIFLQLLIAALLTFVLTVGESSHAAQASSTKKTTSQKKSTPKKKATKQRSQRNVATGNNFKGAVVFNTEDNTVLFSTRADRKVPPASLTKILSMYVAFDLMLEKNISLQTLVPISEKAAQTRGSSMGLVAGETVQLNELFYGMAVASGNDASVAVAEYFGGTEDAFVKLMNKKAQDLGMVHSTFKNAHGLPAKEQFTTAADMLALARKYLAAYPENLHIYHSETMYTHNGRTSQNANSLLANYEGADGLKTGYVAAAGFNLISTVTREDTRLIAVILGSPTPAIREKETIMLLDKAFKNIAVLKAEQHNKQMKMYTATKAEQLNDAKGWLRIKANNEQATAY